MGLMSDDKGMRRKKNIWSPTFIVLVFCSTSVYMVAQGLNSGITVYLSLVGMPALYAGVLAAVFSVSAAIGRLVIGPIVDAYGRMKVSVVGACMLLVGSIMPLVLAGPEVLACARFFQGVGFSVVATASATAAVDVLPKPYLNEGVGFFWLSQSFAYALGPALALFLVSMEYSASLFFGLSIVALCAVLLSLIVNYERNPHHLDANSTYRLRFQNGEVPYAKPHDWVDDNNDKSTNSLQDKDKHKQNSSISSTEKKLGNSERNDIRKMLRRSLRLSTFFTKSALPGAIPMLVICPVFGFGIYFMGLYGTSIGIAVPASFFSIAAAVMIVTRISSGKYMNKMPPIRIYAIAIVCGIISYILVIGAPSSEIYYYLSGIFYGASLGISFPVLNVVAVTNTKPEHWGVANAMVGTACDIGIGLSSILWGLLSDVVGFSVTLRIIIGLFVVAFFVAYAMFPKEKPK